MWTWDSGVKCLKVVSKSSFCYPSPSSRVQIQSTNNIIVQISHCHVNHMMSTSCQTFNDD